MVSPTAFLTAMLAMAPLTAHAHMFMESPVPYGNPDNSPLDPSGSNFPCKKIPSAGAKMNNWPVGSTQKLSFKGTAVHGGGSCQISVTTDKDPTATSKYKVIHSIEGGCPASPKAGGNLLDGDMLNEYNFTIPAELPDGDMTVVVSWMNKVGNREMYAFCAGISVTGGAKDKTGFDALPDMAVANIPSMGTCATTETFDYTFANPGKSVFRDPKGKFMPLCGGSAPVNPLPPPANPPAGNPTSTVRTIVTVTAPLPAPTSQNGTVPSSGCPAHASSKPLDGPQVSGAPQAPAAPPSAGVPTPVPAPSTPSSSPAPGPAPAPGGNNSSTCSPNGSIVCSADGKQFAVCNWGKANFQPVAAGTTCKEGKIAKRHYVLSDASSYTHRHQRTAV